MRNFLSIFAVSAAVFMLIIVNLQFIVHLPNVTFNTYFLENLKASIQFGAIIAFFFGVNYTDLTKSIIFKIKRWRKKE